MTSPNLTLSELNIFPIKSAQGISVSQMALEKRGLRYDRRWMVVDAQGNFLTQRQFPQMTFLSVELRSSDLCLNAPGRSPLMIPLEPSSTQRTSVIVWSDTCQAVEMGSEAHAWISQFLGCPCKLVFMPEDSVRQVNPQYATPTDQTAFSDGFPLLLISEASLQDLNERLPYPVLMKRFRTNLVVRGGTPYQEDRWKRIRIGSIEMRVVKPCSRCTITTINLETGVLEKEPLATLATYRKQDGKVYFGQNLIHSNEGLLKAGDAIEILEIGSPLHPYSP